MLVWPGLSLIPGLHPSSSWEDAQHLATTPGGTPAGTGSASAIPSG